MANKYKPYTLPPCPDDPGENPETPKTPCPDFNICLPFGGRLYTKDGCVIAEKGSPPKDGVYGKIIIANGCIVGVEPVEAVMEHVSPCANVAPPCGGGDSDASWTEPSASTGNLYTLDITGRPLVRCAIKAGSNAIVTGNGTASDPYIISGASINVKTVTVSSVNDAIAVTNDDGAYKLEHKAGKQTTFAGMTFDRYGHLTGTSSTTNSRGVNAVIGTGGITAKTEGNGTVTVSLQKPAKDKSGTYTIGGYEVTIDTYNRITNITPTTVAAAGTYAVGGYDMTLNDSGAIESITASSAGQGINYIFNWPAGGTPTTRVATFTLRYATALGGVLYTSPDTAFWQKLHITIDDLAASFSRVSQDALPFWVLGMFQPGRHILTIKSSVGWPALVGAVVHLFALSPGSGVTES